MGRFRGRDAGQHSEQGYRVPEAENEKKSASTGTRHGLPVDASEIALEGNHHRGSTHYATFGYPDSSTDSSRRGTNRLGLHGGAKFAFFSFFHFSASQPHTLTHIHTNTQGPQQLLGRREWKRDGETGGRLPTTALGNPDFSLGERCVERLRQALNYIAYI